MRSRQHYFEDLDTPYSESSDDWCSEDYISYDHDGGLLHAWVWSVLILIAGIITAVFIWT